jgi:hypothetical protein
MSPKSFRLLVALYVLTSATSAGIAMLLPDLVPQSIAHAIENEPAHAIFENPVLILLLFVSFAVAGVAGTVGLIFFKRWARPLSLWITVLGFAIYPLLGTAVASPWADALSDASFMLWGAILAIAYFSPLRNRFLLQPADDRQLASQVR